jgi:hypothetical protein
VYVLVTGVSSAPGSAAENSGAGQRGEFRATVVDAANLRQLHAEFRGVDDAAAGAALTAAGLGTVDGDHAWLAVSALRAAGDGSADWLAGFDGMLKYAAGQGWTSADGSAVRGHIVRSLPLPGRGARAGRRGPASGRCRLVAYHYLLSR